MTSSKTVPKRFIAGAVCPSCHLVDKIARYHDDEADYIICVSCGYRQQLVDLAINKSQ